MSPSCHLILKALVFSISIVLALSTAHLFPRQTSQNFEEVESIIAVDPLPFMGNENLTCEAQERLDWIIGRYKSFIMDIGFDNIEYEKGAPLLEKYLVSIGTWVESVSPRNVELLKRLNFARHVFKVMEDATKCLSFFTERSTDQYLVRSLIQLNVRLLALRTSSGDPDTSLLTYAADVSSSIRILNSWANLFNYLTDVPLSIRLMFETQFVDASHTLQFLEKHSRSIESVYDSDATLNLESIV